MSASQAELVEAISAVRKLVASRAFDQLSELLASTGKDSSADIALATVRAAYSARKMIPGWGDEVGL